VGDPTWPGIDRSPLSFRERLSFKIQYIDPKHSILFIPEFNNFFEESNLAPDTRYGFTLLEELKTLTASFSS